MSTHTHNHVFGLLLSLLSVVAVVIKTGIYVTDHVPGYDW